MKPSFFALTIALLLAASGSWTRARADDPAADPCQGPPTSVDLEPEMPPVYDQGSEGWCGTFSAKALLDYNIHKSCESAAQDKASCAYSPQNMLSVTDLQSDNSGEDPAVRGKYVDISTPYSEVNDVLEGAQRSGALNDSQLPFDQELFVGNGTNVGLIQQLSIYYDEQSKEASAFNIAGTGCPSDNDPFKDLENRYPLIQQIAAQASAAGGDSGKTAFLTGIEKAYYPIPDSLQSQRKPVAPPYNITLFESTDTTKFENHIVETLGKGQPLAVPVCIFQIIKGAHINAPIDATDACGAHGIVISGFRRSATGQCEVHLRNSWGDHWPPSPDGKHDGDGTVWVDMHLLVHSMNLGTDPKTNGVYEVTSISPRAQDSPVRNVLATDDDTEAGETWHQRMSKGERHQLTPKGTIIERGTFAADSSLKEGTRIFPNGIQAWGTFSPNKGYPACGYIHIPKEGYFCSRNGIVPAIVVTSPKKCSCGR